MACAVLAARIRIQGDRVSAGFTVCGRTVSSGPYKSRPGVTCYIAVSPRCARIHSRSPGKCMLRVLSGLGPPTALALKSLTIKHISALVNKKSKTIIIH